MEEPTNPGGGDGQRGLGESSWGGGGVASTGAESVVEDLEELWPSQPSSAAAPVTKVWYDNPTCSERFTYGLGGVE